LSDPDSRTVNRRLLADGGIVALWIAGTLLIGFELLELSTEANVIAFAVLSVAAGALVGRLWLLWVPVVFALTLVLIGEVVVGCDPDEGCYEEIPAGGLVFLYGAYVLLADSLLALGLLLRAALSGTLTRVRS
jgi:hypothetical protein